MTFRRTRPTPEISAQYVMEGTPDGRLISFEGVVSPQRGVCHFELSISDINEDVPAIAAMWTITRCLRICLAAIDEAS